MAKSKYLRTCFGKIPSPIWVSVYSGESEPENYDLWVKSWLPQQAGVFPRWCGVGVRTPEQARRILDQLEQTLGKDKTVIVLEAFRTKKNGQFRAAYPWEIISQIKAYEGKKFIFLMAPLYGPMVRLYCRSMVSIRLWQHPPP